MSPPKPKHRRQKSSRVAQVLIISGVILLIILILVFKQGKDATVPSNASNTELPAEQLERALAENKL